MIEDTIYSRFEELELDMLKLNDQKNRSGLEYEELYPILDNNVREWKNCITSLIQDVKEWIHDEIGEIVETNNLPQIISTLNSWHTKYKREWERAKDTKEELKAKEVPLKDKISQLKQDFDNLKKDIDELRSIRNQSHPHLSLLTRIMNVEYVQNTDSKVNHAIINIDDKQHRFNSFEQLEAILNETMH